MCHCQRDRGPRVSGIENLFGTLLYTPLYPSLPPYYISPTILDSCCSWCPSTPDKQHPSNLPGFIWFLVLDAGSGECGVWLSFSNKRVCPRGLGSVYLLYSRPVGRCSAQPSLWLPLPGVTRACLAGASTPVAWCKGAYGVCGKFGRGQK